jgi:hypothetical protein
LVPPGTILHFIKSKQQGTKLELSCFGNFSEILIAPGMFWSHLPSQYEGAFRAILQYEKRNGRRETKPPSMFDTDDDDPMLESG